MFNSFSFFFLQKSYLKPTLKIDLNNIRLDGFRFNYNRVYMTLDDDTHFEGKKLHILSQTYMLFS